jgi:hypothetical protein
MKSVDILTAFSNEIARQILANKHANRPALDEGTTERAIADVRTAASSSVVDSCIPSEGWMALISPAADEAADRAEQIIRRNLTLAGGRLAR